LSPHGQTLSVPDASIATDFPEPIDILRDLPTKLPFDGVVIIEQRREPGDITFAQIAGTGRPINPGFTAKFTSGCGTYAIQVSQRYNDLPIVRNIYT